jgi:hypothetical protein
LTVEFFYLFCVSFNKLEINIMDKFTVRNASGEVDVAASANAYAKALSQWVNENEIATDTIETAVEKVFDRTNGSLPMPALVNFAVNEISQDASQFKSLSTRVHAYITGQRKSGRLAVKQGVKGGVTRLALPGQPIPASVAKSA